MNRVKAEVHYSNEVLVNGEATLMVGSCKIYPNGPHVLLTVTQGGKLVELALGVGAVEELIPMLEQSRAALAKEPRH